MHNVLILAITALLLSPSPAAAEWTLLRSPNFTYIGDASERQIRDVAGRMEQFREVMLRALPGARADSPVPTVVVVFRNESSFKPFMPVRDGKLVEVGGYFQGRPDVNFIALNVEFGPLSFPTIFHEYSHFLTGNNASGLPVWLNEGLAGVYESFEMRDGGRSAVIGIVQGSDIRILNEREWLPLAELNAVTHESPIYNGDRLRGLFYAQSWALTHYLMIGSKERTAQLQAYLGRLGAGESSATALPAVFGDLNLLQREVESYVRRWLFNAYVFKFDQQVTGSTLSAAERVPDEEAQGYLGDMLSRARGTAEARTYLQKVLAARPDAARAAAALGSLEARESNLQAALPLLEKAVTVSPRDAGYQAALGRALFRRFRESPDSDANSDALRARAADALAKAWDLNPKVAEVAAMLGYLEADMVRATALMKEAIALEPSREDYRLMLANMMARNRDYVGATDQLARLMVRGSTQEIRTHARSMLSQVAAARQAENERAEARDRAAAGTTAFAGTPAGAASLPENPESTSTAANGSSAAAATNRSASAGSGRSEMLRVEGSQSQILLRPVGAGEARVLGMFTAIECAQDRIALVIETEAGVKRLVSRNMSTVDFISYRQSTPGSVTCGRQTPARVFATYRPAAGTRTADEAVAIELLPDNVVLPRP